MTVKLLNQTNYANIYGLIDENGKTIGTKEVRLAGQDVNTYYDSWSAYTKRQIKKFFKETKEA
jgi:hypothetical protein